MRTPEEIVAFYETKKSDDWLGVMGSDILIYVPKPLVTPYLKSPDVEWDAQLLTDETILDTMRDYMPFAIGKAEDERGISAGRSIQHFQAWLFLIGDDEMLAFAEDDDNYDPYGKPILRAIAAKYGFATVPE